MPLIGTRRPSPVPTRRTDVGLLDPAARAGTGEPDELDAELLREPADGRRRTDGLRRLGRDDRDDRLGAGDVGARVAPLDGAEQLLALLADHHEHGPDGRNLAFRDEDHEDGAGAGRGNLDGRLVRLDLDERIVLLDGLPFGHEPARDLGLRQALAEVGQLELVRHGGAGY